jgi:hypothetical protein
MQKNRVPPLPFLVLFLAGVVSLVSIFTERNSPAKMAKEDPLKVQTVEQERMAALYFRILSWLSDLASKGSAPPKAAPQSPRVSQAVKTWHAPAGRGKVELCTLPAEPAVVGVKCLARNSQPAFPSPIGKLAPEQFQVLLPEVPGVF